MYVIDSLGEQTCVSVKKTDSIARVLQNLMYQGTGSLPTDNIKCYACLNRSYVGGEIFH